MLRKLNKRNKQQGTNKNMLMKSRYNPSVKKLNVSALTFISTKRKKKYFKLMDSYFVKEVSLKSPKKIYQFAEESAFYHVNVALLTRFHCL